MFTFREVEPSNRMFTLFGTLDFRGASISTSRESDFFEIISIVTELEWQIRSYHDWLPSLWPTTENPNIESGFLSYLTLVPKSTLNPPVGSTRTHKAVTNSQPHLAAQGRTNQAILATGCAHFLHHCFTFCHRHSFTNHVFQSMNAAVTGFV